MKGGNVAILRDRIGQSHPLPGCPDFRARYVAIPMPEPRQGPRKDAGGRFDPPLCVDIRRLGLLCGAAASPLHSRRLRSIAELAFQ
ncbi:MAG: hypothetical protein J0M20_13260 [Burkholderiales bacterium]|nr:hypothetical protein [Burkholderiales bacterium]